MRTYESWRKKVLSANLPITLDDIRTLYKEADQWLEAVRTGTQAPELADTKRQYLTLQAERRGRASDEAVADGYIMSKIYTLSGPEGWSRHLADIGKSTRTGFNLIALAQFAHREPDLYRRLRTLGPSKLYPVARLSRDQILKLYPGAQAEIAPGVVKKVADLTAKEMETYLQKLHPPETRPIWIRVRRKAVFIHQMIENGVKTQLPRPVEAKEIRNLLDGASLRLQDAAKMAG